MAKSFRRKSRVTKMLRKKGVTQKRRYPKKALPKKRGGLRSMVLNIPETYDEYIAMEKKSDLLAMCKNITDFHTEEYTKNNRTKIQEAYDKWKSSKSPEDKKKYDDAFYDEYGIKSTGVHLTFENRNDY